jgi:hypothetical protein
MKNRAIALLAFPLAFAGSCLAADPLGSQFLFTGFLSDQNGQPVTPGTYLFRAYLYDAADIGTGNLVGNSPQTSPSVSVANGVFQVAFDFGAGAFRGTDLWLEVWPRGPTDPDFVQMPQRFLLTATPYALYAPIAGAVTNGSVTADSIRDATIIGGKIAAGQVVKSVNSLTDNVNLQGGGGVTVGASGNTLTISSPTLQPGANVTLTPNATTPSPSPPRSIRPKPSRR